MDPIILDNIIYTPSIPSLAKKLCIKSDSDEYAELSVLIETAVKTAKPKAVYMPVFIEDRGADFVVLNDCRMLSTVMPKNLEGLHRVFAYVATCGIEIEQYSKTVTDILHNWWMNTIMEDALIQAVTTLRKHVKAEFDVKKIASMSPGSLPDWPISEQTKLFSLFGDVEELIGVKLTDSMLMIPAKSVSGFYFETETDYVNCQLCKRQNCPSRKSPFDEKKLSSILGS